MSRSKIATLAPSSASRSLIASPMPDAPPVTIAVDPKNDISDSSWSCGARSARAGCVPVPIAHLLEDPDRELTALGHVVLHDPLRLVRIALLQRGEDPLVVTRRRLGPAGHELEVPHRQTA